MGWKDKISSLVGPEKADELFGRYSCKADMAKAILQGELKDEDITNDSEILKEFLAVLDIEVATEESSDSEADEATEESSDSEADEATEEELPLLGLNIRNLQNQKTEIVFTREDGSGCTLIIPPNGTLLGVPVEVVKSPHFSDLMDNGIVSKTGTSPLKKY